MNNNIFILLLPIFLIGNSCKDATEVTYNTLDFEGKSNIGATNVLKSAFEKREYLIQDWENDSTLYLAKKMDLTAFYSSIFKDYPEIVELAKDFPLWCFIDVDLSDDKLDKLVVYTILEIREEFRTSPNLKSALNDLTAGSMPFNSMLQINLPLKYSQNDDWDVQVSLDYLFDDKLPFYEFEEMVYKLLYTFNLFETVGLYNELSTFRDIDQAAIDSIGTLFKKTK